MTDSRRHGFIAAIAAVLLGATAACGGPPSGSDVDDTLDIATQDKYANLPLLVAYDQGYLAEMGIENINLLTFNSIPALTTAVSKGQADIGMQTAAVIETANRQGGERMRFIEVAGQDILWWVQREDPTFHVADSDDEWREVIRSWDGHKVGIPALGGSMEKNITAMIEGAGLTTEDIELVPVGIGGSGLAALEQGLVDAVGGSSSSAGQVLVDGLGQVAMGGTQQPEQLAGTYTGAWFITDGQAAQREEFYSGLVDASVRAKQFIADPANKQAVVDTIVTHVGVDPDIAGIMFDLDHQGIGNSAGTREDMEKTLETAVELGYMPGPVPAFEDIVHVNLWPNS